MKYRRACLLKGPLLTYVRKLSSIHSRNLDCCSIVHPADSRIAEFLHEDQGLWSCRLSCKGTEILLSEKCKKVKPNPKPSPEYTYLLDKFDSLLWMPTCHHAIIILVKKNYYHWIPTLFPTHIYFSMWKINVSWGLLFPSGLLEELTLFLGLLSTISGINLWHFSKCNLELNCRERFLCLQKVLVSVGVV